MGANQGEARGMFSDRLHPVLPAANRMAIFALGTELAAMYVGVTIRAFRAGVAENQLRVAQPALHLFVHASQWKTGFVVVIKLRNGPYRRPTRRSVTTAAGRLQQRPMRVARRAALHLSRPRIRGRRVTR